MNIVAIIQYSYIDCETVLQVFPVVYHVFICVGWQVLVIIDAEPKDHNIGLPTEAYIAVEEVHDVSDIWLLFLHVLLFIYQSVQHL